MRKTDLKDSKLNMGIVAVIQVRVTESQNEQGESRLNDKVCPNCHKNVHYVKCEL
jgi:predicted HNH restriction endonuclease